LQHINLFNQIERHVEPMLSARRQAQLLGVIAGVWVVAFMVLLFDQRAQKNELDQVRSQQAQTEQQLTAASAEIQRLMTDPTLANDVSALKEKVAFRKQVIARIGSMDPTTAQGFAGHLKGLARQSLSGLWFTRIDLSNGGQEMALVGKTRKPEYLPQYIQRLSEEMIFKGQQFRVFRLSTPEKSNGILDFEIRAQDEVTASR